MVAMWDRENRIERSDRGYRQCSLRVLRVGVFRSFSKVAG